MTDLQQATGVSIVMPAYCAEATIARAVRSVLDQSHRIWELLVVADDAADYEAVLGREGITDPRIRHFATGAIGSGSPRARNTGLDRAEYAISAILDADDRFAPQKLARALPHLRDHGIVSSALSVESADGRLLRTIGAGHDRVLDPGQYKFVNLSMDSMLVYDRTRADPRFDESFPCLTDIAFLLRLLERSKGVFHIGEPLHIYVKQPLSVSNKPGAGAAMAVTKQRLISMLERDQVPLADPSGRDGLLRFYRTSLAAEQSYADALADRPGLLFEDHLEPLLGAISGQP